MSAIQSGDLNGDTKPDLVAVLTDTNAIEILLNTTSQVQPTVTPTVTPTQTATPQPAATNTQASDNDGCSMTPGASADWSMLWLLIPVALVAWRRQAGKASRWSTSLSGTRRSLRAKRAT
ncbi:MAG: hypothetical protein ABSA52_23280 [Candidatus Binatia bacterium]